MKVKELIETLSKANPEAEVLKFAWNGVGNTFAVVDFVDIKSKFWAIGADLVYQKGEWDERVFDIDEDDDIVVIGSLWEMQLDRDVKNSEEENNDSPDNPDE